MWMNEHEIDRVVSLTEEHLPEVYPFAKYLSDWRDVVNANSDGWPHWTAGSKCADKLQDLLNEAVKSLRGQGQVPPRELFLKSLSPIKSFATRKGFDAPELEVAPAAPEGPRGPGM